jgi:hypothetical protein
MCTKSVRERGILQRRFMGIGPKAIDVRAMQTIAQSKSRSPREALQQVLTPGGGGKKQR